MSESSERPYGFKYHWEVIQKSIKNIDDRRKGRIKSFVTPWDTINNATAGGIEWGSLVTIGARPGAGKTMFVSNLLRDCKALNPTQDFNILEFQFEMTNEQYGQREIVAENRSILLAALILVYMIVFGHGLPSSINKNLF